jgi:hypothetical protein
MEIDELTNLRIDGLDDPIANASMNPSIARFVDSSISWI